MDLLFFVLNNYFSVINFAHRHNKYPFNLRNININNDMKNLINLLVFENDKYFLALVNGYCHARKIGMKVADY